MRALFLIVALVLAGGALWASESSRGGLALPGSDAARSGRGDRGDSRDQTERRARRRARERRRRDGSPLPESSCPDALERCRSVEGRVLYVESVDPDGDGDLHVVLSGGGVSGPGITAVDIRPGLRWRRDPRPGDRVSAAGQVQRGSFGQAQIHAVEVHLRRG